MRLTTPFLPLRELRTRVVYQHFTLRHHKLTDTVPQGHVSPPELLVSPSLSFHQWSIVPIFIIPLSEGQAEVTWGP
jgi:hypothetical protein